jgi:hypothetical protein
MAYRDYCGHAHQRPTDPYLEQGRYFIPSQAGLDDLQGAYAEWIPGLDHAWHELDDVTATSERPTEAISAEELLQRFATVRWDEAQHVQISQKP